MTKTVDCGRLGPRQLRPRRPKLNAKLPDQLVNDMKTVKDQGWGKLTPMK